jgi:hypothetical protein
MQCVRRLAHTAADAVRVGEADALAGGGVGGGMTMMGLAPAQQVRNRGL